MKTVFITGASRGIGRAMVELFSENGWQVAFTYKNSDAAATEISEKYGALAIKADSASFLEIERAVSIARDAFGHVDCLINNAAISSVSLLTELSLDEWNEIISVNLTSAFLYSKAFIPDMVARGEGRIINVSSMWGCVGASLEVAYSASKAALIGMTKALAKELGPSGITVNAIAPGVIATDMNSNLSEDDLSALKEETPLMRIGKAEEVAKVALFLAGDGAAFITGDVLNVSGGFIV